MTSSSSLYGSVNTQNTNSTNSTSLYGGADTPIPSPEGDLVVRGDLVVLSGNILTTATTGNIFPTNATTINLGNSATTVNIGSGTGTTTINNNLVAQSADFGNITIAVADDQTITTTTGELRLSSTSTAIKLPGVTSIYTDTTTTFNLLNQPTTINAFRNATTLEIGEDTGTTGINNNLRIDGTDINLAQGTSLLYSEAGNRLNRPQIQSTTGNSSGLRVIAPNTGSTALSSLSVGNSSDSLNTEFLALQARGSALTDTFRIVTGEYIAGVQTATNKSVAFTDNTNTYATVNPAGPTIGTDLTTKTYVDAQVAGSVTSITGTADQVIASSPTGAVTLSLPQSIATTSNPTFAGATLGNIKVGVTDNNTIDTTTSTLKLGATDGQVGLVGVDTLYTDTTGTFLLLNAPTTIYAFDSATTLELGDVTGSTTVRNDLTVGGDNINLAQSTLFGYSEANNRANRPEVKSTTGNSSGFRVLAPNATTSAASNLSAFSSDDIDNGKFINVSARGASTGDLRIATGKYTAGVLGDSGTVVSFVDNVTTYATVNPAGPTDATDLTTKSYVDGLIPDVPTYDTNVAPTTGGVDLQLRELNPPGVTVVGTTTFLGGTNVTVSETAPNVITIDAPDTNTTYTVDASSTTGGANFNLVGSDATTDTIKFSGGGSTTVSQTSANEITVSSVDTNTTYTIDASSTTGGANLNLVGSDSSTDTVKIASGTGVTVAQTSANELSVAIGQPVGTTADVTFNTVNSNITDDNYVLGQLYLTRNTSYVPPSSPLTTVSGTNGIVVASSSGGAAGYNAGVTLRYHVGDTTAGAFSAAAVTQSVAGGTNMAPSGISTNAVLGTTNYDGYTAGTSNNYTNQIASANQGAGVNAITALQAQAYARQAFTNSTTVTTAVTGASGTGTTATLTFTTQNTAPYAVGQSVTIAGMTPSTYNGTYTITAATTSSISYASSATGFTSGGTIAAANTVTAAGAGFRIRGFANSTPMTTGNRFNFMDLTASAATFKSNTYTFADEVITGSTLTAKNYMTLGATTGSINQDTFTLKNTAGTTTYATLNSTSATLNGDTVNLRNTAGTTTYGNFTATGSTITGAGLHTFTRTTATETPGTPMSRPALNIQLTRSDQAAPNNGDNTSFRTRVAGSNGTFYTISDIGSVYSTTGDNEFRVNLANGDQTTGSFSGLSILSSKISETRIKAGTPSGTPGASTVSDIAIFDPNKITATVPIKFPTYTAAQANAITGAVGWQISISDSAGGSNPNGMMAFWDTTNARWSYIHDNSAV